MSNKSGSDGKKDDLHPMKLKKGRVKALPNEYPYSFEEKVLKSLAAQQKSISTAIVVPEMASTFTSASLKAFQNIQQEFAYQENLRKMVGFEVAKSSLAFQGIHERAFAETQAIARMAKEADKIAEALKTTAFIPQLAGENLLSDMRSVLKSRMEAEAALLPIKQKIAEFQRNVETSIHSSVIKFIATQAAFIKQIDSVRQSQLLHGKLSAEFANIQARFDSIGLNRLGDLLNSIAASHDIVIEWDEDVINAASSQFEADLKEIPESQTWCLEKQLNYLISWTIKQDNIFWKVLLLAIIPNLLSSRIDEHVIKPLISCFTESVISSPKNAVRHVREQIRILVGDTAEVSDLRIVCKSSLILRKEKNSRSQKIATLHAGSVVKEVSKSNKWVYVDWINPVTGANVKGWVLSKYLSRVDRKPAISWSVQIDIHVEHDLTESN
jgi:hypothetical protein